MPIIPSTDAAVFATHGSTFAAYVSPSRGGGDQLCAWRLRVPAGTNGMPHRPDRDEVLLIVEGDLQVSLDGVRGRAHTGDVVVVPANAEVCIDGGDTDAAAWVTTTPGLTATTAVGEAITPPWSL